MPDAPFHLNHGNIRVQPRGAAARVVWWLSLANLALVVTLVVLIEVVSENWWFSTALVYLPRSPYLMPSLILAPCAGLWLRKTDLLHAILLNAMAALLVAWPLMGARLNFAPNDPAIGNPERRLCVVSCNVQAFRPEFDLVLRELTSIQPDVVVFQEAINSHPLFEPYFQDWYKAGFDEYFVASRFPVKMVANHRSEAFHRTDAIQLEVDGPTGKFLVYNVHQTTPRFGLVTLKPRTMFSDAGHAKLDAHTARREAEAIGVRSFIEDDRSDVPKVICGDFNMPDDSSLYQSCWGDISNAFDVAGFGYGYTAPCHTRRQWPEGVPWARVDHILVSQHWSVRRCWIGSGNGSDHRLIAAVLELK